jgi:hypothetical protein
MASRPARQVSRNLPVGAGEDEPEFVGEDRRLDAIAGAEFV